MRTMLRITIPTETGNRAIKDGSLQKVLAATMEKLKPEAVYFVTHNGLRSGMLFFDMKDSSEVPAIAEPLFQQLDATCEFLPAMNGADLQKGLSAHA